MTEIRVDYRREGPWIVVDVGGEVDVATAPKLSERLDVFYGERSERVLVNLERVWFIDSTGLGVLIGASKRWNERGGTFALAAPGESVMKVLRIVGLHDRLTIFESVADAIGTEE